MREYIVSGALVMLKTYLWLLLIPFCLFGFFCDE